MLTRGHSEDARRPGQQQTWCQRLYNRQLGNRSREPIGSTLRRIYSHMGSTNSPFPSDITNTGHGGIFNLSFSDDGRTLVAATERRRILVLDPLSHKLVHSVSDAHEDCVNYVRFLDSRVSSAPQAATGEHVEEKSILPITKPGTDSEIPEYTKSLRVRMASDIFLCAGDRFLFRRYDD